MGSTALAKDCSTFGRHLEVKTAMLYYTILYYTILYNTTLYFAILYYTILYFTLLHIKETSVMSTVPKPRQTTRARQGKLLVEELGYGYFSL